MQRCGSLRGHAPANGALQRARAARGSRLVAQRLPGHAQQRRVCRSQAPESAGDASTAASASAAAGAASDAAHLQLDTFAAADEHGGVPQAAAPPAEQPPQQQQSKQQQQQQQQQLQRPRSARVNPAACPQCDGSGRAPCKECDGTGRLKRGGFQKSNRVDLGRILDSKWTAMETTLGWRHFRCIQVRKAGKRATFLLLQASCDHSCQLWINSENLKDRQRWASGWLQMSEILGQAEGAVGSGQVCRSCSGLGVKVCVACEGSGQARLVVL